MTNHLKNMIKDTLESEFSNLEQIKRSALHEPIPANYVTGLDKLAKDFIKPDYTIVEIGSFAGVSTWALALYAKKVYSVDVIHDNSLLQKLATSQHKVAAISNSNYSVPDVQETYEYMLKMNSNVIPIKDTSVRAAYNFERHSIDGIYVDGDHTWFGVSNDLYAWTDKVKPTGFISGHDWFDKDIMEVIRELMDKLNIPEKQLVIYKDTSWAFSLS